MFDQLVNFLRSSEFSALSFGIVVVFLVAIQTFVFGKKLFNKLSTSEEYLREIADKAKKPIEIITKKRIMENSRPKTFYYLDYSLVESLFTQLNQEPKPKEMEMETEKKQKSDFGGKLKFITADLGKEKSEKTKTTYDLTLDITSKYNIIEKNILDSPYINFNVEDFTYDESQFDELKKIITKLKDIDNISRIEKAVAEVIKEQISKLAFEKIEAISKLSGYIAIIAEFETLYHGDQTVHLQFYHPLNEFIDGEKQVSIYIEGNTNHLTDLGKISFTTYKNIKIICLAKIINWDDDANTLYVYPIAIY